MGARLEWAQVAPAASACHAADAENLIGDGNELDVPLSPAGSGAMGAIS